MYKKITALIAVLALAFAPMAFATAETELTPNGVSQGALVNVLYNLQTTVNELAADHDADNATVAELVADHDADNNEFALAVTELTELAADHDADNGVLDAYNTAITELAADHDADNDEFALAVTELTELKADHDADNNVIDDVIALANGLRTYLADGLLAIGTLAVTAPTHQYKTTTTAIYTISGVAYAKVAEDTLTFTAADTINVTPNAGDFWGAWLVQTTGAGVISTKSVGADQNYASEAEAIAALPAADALNVAVGYITVEANNGASWTANTDDLVAASDCQAVSFVDSTVKTVPSAVVSAPAADLTAANPTGFAADLAAANPTGFAADLAATSVAADLTADSVLGSGTVADPKVSLTD